MKWTLSRIAIAGAGRPSTRRRTTAIAVAVATVALAGTAVVTLGADQPGTAPGTAPDTEPGDAMRPPGVAVFADGVVTRPDGSTVDTGVTRGLPEHAVLADGRVVLAGPQDGDLNRTEISVYEPDGSVTATYVGGPESVYLDPTAVAWVEIDGRLRVLAPGMPEPLTLPGPPNKLPDRDAFQGFVISDVDCAGATADCAVVVDYRKVPPALEAEARGAATLRVTADGTEVDDVPELVRDRTDVSADGTTWALRETTPAKSCLGLYDVADRAITARYCDDDVALERARFSPDGEHVISVPDYGAPTREIDVFDRDLRLLRTIRLPEGQIVTDHAWAGEDSLVLAVMDETPLVPPTPQGEDLTGGRYTWRLLDQPIDGGEPTLLAGPTEGASYDLDPLWSLGPDER